jgi:hypothetical protein
LDGVVVVVVVVVVVMVLVTRLGVHIPHLAMKTDRKV